VAGGNVAPVLDPLPATITINEGEAWQIPVHATDTDGDTLVYWADHLPPWATFAPATHTLNLNPDFASAGTYPGVTLYASDGGTTVSESFTLQLASAPQPPVFAVPGPRTLREGDTFITYFSAGSPDGTPVTFSSTALPAGAVLAPTTGRFQWTPAYNQSG